MAEKITGPMRVALLAASDSAAGTIPKGTNYNVYMSLWKRKLIDDHNNITPYGRAALSDEMARRKRQPAHAGLGHG